MKKSKLKKRVAELEVRIAALEARPVYYWTYTPNTQPQWWQNPITSPTITYGTSTARSNLGLVMPTDDGDEGLAGAVA